MAYEGELVVENGDFSLVAERLIIRTILVLCGSSVGRHHCDSQTTVESHTRTTAIKCVLRITVASSQSAFCYVLYPAV